MTRRRRRLAKRAAAPTVRRRVEDLLMTVKRPRRLVEVAGAPALAGVRWPDVFRALASLVERGVVRWAQSARLGRDRLTVGLVFPVYWHRIWSFPHLVAVDGGRRADHV